MHFLLLDEPTSASAQANTIICIINGNALVPSPAVGICTYEKLDFLERRRESLSRLHYHARIQPESYGAVSMCRSLWIIPKSFPIGFHVTPICRTISSSFLHRPETACDSRSRQAMVDHHNFHAATPPSLLNMFSHTHDRFVFALSQLASGCGEQTLRPVWRTLSIFELLTQCTISHSRMICSRGSEREREANERSQHGVGWDGRFLTLRSAVADWLEQSDLA